MMVVLLSPSRNNIIRCAALCHCPCLSTPTNLYALGPGGIPDINGLDLLGGTFESGLFKIVTVICYVLPVRLNHTPIHFT